MQTRTVTLENVGDEFLDTCIKVWKQREEYKHRESFSDSENNRIQDHLWEAIREAVAFLSLWSNASPNKTRVFITGIAEGHNEGAIRACYKDDSDNVRFAMMGFLHGKKKGPYNVSTFKFHS